MFKFRLFCVEMNFRLSGVKNYGMLNANQIFAEAGCLMDYAEERRFVRKGGRERLAKGSSDVWEG